MDDRVLARWRLQSLRLSRTTWPTAPEVVAGLLAVQAENHPQASWAVAARTPGTTEAAFARCFDAGEVLRTHVLRPTWHFVRPDDIRWLVELTAPRNRPLLVRAQQELGMSDADVDAGAQAIEEVLAGGVHLTRDELAQRLADRGLPADRARLGVLLNHAELSALVCSGAVNEDGQHTWALLAERAPAARRLDRDEALAELALRYVASHGPVTERDLAYWATSTLADVRAGLAAVAGQLDHLEHDGRTFWFAGPRPDDAPPDPRAHLLQVLDEYHNGVQDSRGLLDVDGRRPAGRPATMGMTLVDGQVVGGMRRTVTTAAVTFEVDAYRDLADDELAALDDAADRYGRFLDREPTVVVQPSARR